MDDGDSMQMGFVQRRLHWVIAAVFFALYFLTLSRWVTGDSLVSVSKVTGWDWSPQISNPLLYLITLPVKWFPGGLQPLVLNLLGALLGALTLGQLARSVALLPHDRTRDQRQKERSDYSLLSLSAAWMPPLLASLICGLQLSFWEEATAMTGGILSVFLFSFLIRCVLEFRLVQDDRWLFRLACVYGFAVPSDWAFIGYFPLFFGAVVWSKGVGVFRPEFSIRMIGLGCIGLLTYLILPALVVFSEPSAGSFVDLLKLQLGSQKNFLMGIPKTVVLLLSLTSILPVLVMGIRFPSSIGDVSVVGSMLSNFMFRSMHILFLAACVWVAFDPAFSPRSVSAGLPVDFLTFYYLGALAVGYFSGYVLLVFGRSPSSRRRQSRENPVLNFLISGLLWILVVAAPLGLLFRNLPLMRVINGDQYATFSEMVLRNLPEGKSLVLADDSYSVLLVRSQLAREGLDRDYVFVDLSALPIGYYEGKLRKQIAGVWPSLEENNAIPEQLNVLSLLGLLGEISRQSPVYYLNSSFGVYFEVFYPRQRGLVTELVAYQADEPRPPLMSEGEIEANQSFWNELSTRLSGLATGVENRDNGSLALGAWASRELNVWGVSLQSQGRLEQAKAAFDQALSWNPQNTCVRVNLRQNEVLQKNGGGTTVGLTDSETKQVQQNYGTYEQLLSANGPIDEASFRLLLAAEFARGGNQRQSMMNYDRAAALDPENVQPKLALVNSYLLAGFADLVLGGVADIKAKHSDLDTKSRSELVRLEALGHYAVGNQAGAAGDEEAKTASFERAEGLLKLALEDDPKNSSLFETLSQVYLYTGRFTEALELFDRHLEFSPDDPQLLQNKAMAHLRLKEYQKAIAPLSRSLTIDASNVFARLNRAIAYFRIGDFVNAKQDYETVAEKVPTQFSVYFGLGKIAEADGDTNSAIKHFERYLELAPKGTDEYRSISTDLERLKGQ